MRDANDVWIVESREGKRGGVRNGDIIQLQHRESKAYLHSHPNHVSPATKQQVHPSHFVIASSLHVYFDHGN
jgi:dolichyl-phosphate-mannose--protein O-mannosyl transferase